MPIDTRSTMPPGDAVISGPHACQTQWWARVMRKMLRNRVLAESAYGCCPSQIVEGKEVLEQLKGPAIFIANRQGPMDIPMILGALPESIQDNTYFGTPADDCYLHGENQQILQSWYQSLVLGSFPIIRDGGSKTLEYAKGLLRQGCNVCIFPEDNPAGARLGSPALGGGLGKFRHGVSILAKAARVPIVLQGWRGVASADRSASGPITILEPLRLSLGMGVVESTELLRRQMNAVLVS